MYSLSPRSIEELKDATIELVIHDDLAGHGRLKCLAWFPSGLARRVGLYEFESSNGTRSKVVLAFGIDASNSERNIVLLDTVPSKVLRAIARVFFVHTFSGDHYVEASEYLRGSRFSDLLRTALPAVGLSLVSSVTNSLARLHETRTGQPLAGGYNTWERYHRPRCERRLREWGSLPLAKQVIECPQSLTIQGKGDAINLPSLTQSIKELDASVQNFVFGQNADLSLVHGDCKPENIIVHRTKARMIDAQLFIGDPFVDYAKLYYWILTDCLWSHLPISADAEYSITTRTSTDSNSWLVKLEPSHRSRGLAAAFLELLGYHAWSVEQRIRFELSCGSVLLWQSGRLLSITRENAAATPGEPELAWIPITLPLLLSALHFGRAQGLLRANIASPAPWPHEL